MRPNSQRQNRFSQHAFLRVLTLLLVLWSGLVPASSAMWQCEGRACGKLDWACCCVLPESAAPLSLDCDAESSTRSHFQSLLHQNEVGDCSVDCHCSIVRGERGAVVAQSYHAFVAPHLYVAILPRAFEFQAPIAVSTVRLLPSRGPPRTSLSFASPSLRAPPVA